jgi:hypothetical protein
LREGDESSGGNPADAVLHTIPRSFPDGLTEPDLEFINFESPPPGGEEVPPFMDEDHDVEDHQREEDGPSGMEQGQDSGHEPD